MLYVKSIRDIKHVEIDPEKERIRIAPNHVNVLYLYKSLPFSYETGLHIPEEFSYLPIPNIADHYAEFSRVVYTFEERGSGKLVSLPYYLIRVWGEIDEEFRDVFLMHELSEMQHRTIGKQSKETAHERAVRKTESYIQRYLMQEEIERFNRMYEDLPERRGRKSDVKVF